LPSTLPFCFFVASCSTSRIFIVFRLDDELTFEVVFDSFLFWPSLPPQGHLRCHQLENWLEWAGMG
jgi:hypothetical protein